MKLFIYETPAGLTGMFFKNHSISVNAKDMNEAPIYIVEDDQDDREFLQSAWKELGHENPLKFFDNGKEILKCLESEETIPFLILCDVNLPKMNGFELKQHIENSHLKYKSVPFIFWSTFAVAAQVKKAYDLSGHGFFIKGTRFEDIKQSLVNIYQYWQKSMVPE